MKNLYKILKNVMEVIREKLSHETLDNSPMKINSDNSDNSDLWKVIYQK